MEIPFFGLFSCREDIETYFEIELADDVEILFASYDEGNNAGKAYVLFRQQEMLFEVSAHYSACMSLEGQWDPEETSPDALRWVIGNGMRFDKHCGWASGEAVEYLNNLVLDLRCG